MRRHGLGLAAVLLMSGCSAPWEAPNQLGPIGESSSALLYAQEMSTRDFVSYHSTTVEFGRSNGLMGQPARATLDSVTFLSSANPDPESCGGTTAKVHVSDGEFAELYNLAVVHTPLSIVISCTTTDGIPGTVVSHSYEKTFSLRETVGNGYANLAWSGAALGTTSYDLYRDGALYATGINATSFVDNAVVNGTKYFYYLRSNLGERSNDIAARPLATPQILGYTAGVSGTVIEYTPVVGAQWYTLWRRDGSGAVAEVASTRYLGQTDSMVDPGWPGGTEVQYWVVATGDGDLPSTFREKFNSEPSPEVAVTNPNPGPRESESIWAGGSLFRTNDRGDRIALGGPDWTDTSCAISPTRDPILYAIDAGYLYRIDADGTRTVLGGHDWVGATGLAAGPGGNLYALQDQMLWRINRETGQYERWGTEDWPTSAAMASTGITNDLFIIRDGALFLISQADGHSTQVGPRQWLGRKWLMTSPWSSLFVVEDRSLWEVSDVDSNATFIRSVPNTTAVTSRAGLVYLIEGDWLYRYNPADGAHDRISSGWRGATVLAGVGQFF